VRVVIATRNPGKLAEMRPMLESAGLEAVDLATLGIEESPEEAGIECFDTFEENAIAKARYFGGRAGLPAIADDSGLEVDALAGRPGVHSKRFSRRDDLEGQALDDANNALLLREIANYEDRSARYRCAAAFVDGPRELVAMGSTEGKIVDAPRGAHGFGYDPYFESAELGRTFGECDVATKEAISHRGRAMRALLAMIREGS
jgi:XTP/dITP diphosphohydrolase